MCPKYFCQWASTGCGPPACGPSACEPLPLPRPCTGQLGCQMLAAIKEAMPAGGLPSAPACAETVTPSSQYSAACLQRPVPFAVNQPVPAIHTPLEAQPHQQAVECNAIAIALLCHTTNNYCDSSLQLSQVRWPCNGKAAKHVFAHIDLCSSTCLFCPGRPTPASQVAVYVPRNLGLLVWEAHPVAAPPRPSPAAAAAAGAAPSPLSPKVAVRIGQSAKGFSVLLALLLEGHAAAAGCRAVKASMLGALGEGPEECSSCLQQY